MKSKTASFFKNFGICLLILFIVFTVFLAYGHINNRWYRFVYVKSNSMAPTFNAGDLILITKPPHKIERGMIICFQIKGEIVAHRVMAINEDGSYKTKGDANDIPDDWGNYKIKKIAGVYHFRIPYLGYLTAYLDYSAKKAIGKIRTIFVGANAFFVNQDKISMGITAEDPPKVKSLNTEEGQNTTGKEEETLEDGAPTIDTFNINDDESTTESREVILNISASDEVSLPENLQMRIANDGENWPDENTGWENYSTSKNWQLSEGEGKKEVYLQIKDEAGNTSSTSDTISYAPTDVEDEKDSQDTGENDEEDTGENEGETTGDEES